MEMKELRGIRKNVLKLTQGEMAVKLGVSMTSLQLWERQVTKPNEENMAKLERLIEEG